MTTATKPAATRTLRWTPNHDDYSPTCGALEITQGKNTTVYTVAEFPTGLTGRGFHVTKLGGEGYACVISCRSPQYDSCECPAWTLGRKRCRHVSAIRKLIEVGKI